MLSMLYPRLYLAKMLLKDDGVIFCSIDDRNQAYVKCLFDEVFGERNFVSTYPRLTIKGGKTQTNLTTNNLDYILCYAKNKQSLKFNKISMVGDNAFKYSDKHEAKRGKYHTKQALDTSSLGYVPSLDYPIIHNGTTYYPGGTQEKNAFRWTWSKDLYEFALKNDFVEFKNNRIFPKKYLYASIKGDQKDGYYIEYEEKEKNYSQFTFVDNKFSNRYGDNDLEMLNMKKAFDYPKPVNLIKHLLKISTNVKAGDSESVEEACHSEGAQGATEESLKESLVANSNSSPLAVVRDDNKSQTSFSSEIYSHCDKIKSHEVPPLKASSGWGIYKGEGATSQFKPLPLIEKEKIESLERQLLCHSEGAQGATEESLKESLVAKRDSSPLAGVQNDKNANSNSLVVSTPARGDNESGISNRDSSLVSQAQNDNVERDSSASPQNDKNGQGLQSENLQKDSVLACENGSNAEVSSQDFSKSGVSGNLQGEGLKKEFSKSEQDFGDKNGALQGEARELPQRVMTEAKTQQSPFYLQKTSTEEGDIVLDFFAGSGTTAHAVLELNKEDGGKRKFILVTNDEITELNPNGIAEDVTAKRLKRIMSGECYNGEKNFKWLEKNAPYGGNLEVSRVKVLSAFNEEIFQEIDERLYGLPKFENMHEKIKWVCENFQSTMKKLTMQDKDEAVYEKALKEELKRLKNDK
ncbi:hypothetical protein CQA63_06035 [Helicobacter marmotae]|uniref:DNA methylase N-4/N-6 domain-containing protein n=2 Tax=Helicobacter marmotae TaxID=152490 RepID=A0A3D8I3E4_9HELI|nr:hypothetical protein CQA63_06035 [Helicobacter marmotae]